MLFAVLATLAGLSAPVDVAVTLDQDRVTVARGEKFTVRSRIVNQGTAPLAPAKAQVNVASLTGAVSVDPEDWSGSPIVDLPALAPGESTSVSWELKAGDIGGFALYVVVLPAEARGPGAAVKASAPAYVEAFARETVDAAATVPYVVGIPVVLGAAAGAAGWRSRRVR